MAEHIWSVLCSKMLTDDQGGGTVSLLDVVEKFYLDADVERELKRLQGEGQRGMLFPLRMELISWWLRSDIAKPEFFQMRVELLSPTEEELFSQETEIDLNDLASRRMRLRIPKMYFVGFGVYWIVVMQEATTRKGKRGWTIATRLPIEIASKPAEGDST